MTLSPRMRSALLGRPIAHRGLWSADGAPENSLTAFDAACRAGYGIELDVQLSADGEAIVFHDEGLERMTGASERLERKTSRALAALKLKGSDQAIPTLDEALEQIGIRTGVLIELKTPIGRHGPLEARVASVVAQRQALCAYISFNAQALEEMKGLDEKTPRGLTAKGPPLDPDGDLPWQLQFADLVQQTVADHQFMNLELDVLASPEARRAREAGLPVIAWTVRRADHLTAVKPFCDNYMFEGLRP